MIQNADFDLSFYPGARVHNYSIIGSGVVIGSATTIWAFCRIFDGVIIERYCSIGTGVYIGRNTFIDEETRIGDGCHITDHMTIGKRVFIAPHVVFCNDRYPVVNNEHYKLEPPKVYDDVSIGVNATILPGVILEQGCRVGAGSVVTHRVPAGLTVAGNPARVLHPRDLDPLNLMRIDNE